VSQDAGLQDAGLQDAGLQDAGLQGTGLQDAGLQGTGLQGTGLQGTGLQGTGLAGFGEADAGLSDAGSAGPGLAGPGLAGPGLAGPGLAGPGLAGPESAGSELAGTGLAGPGLAGPGLAGTGTDDAETAPLVALSELVRVSFDSEISRLARLAVTGDGELHARASDARASDSSVLGSSVPDDRVPDDRVPDDRVPDGGVADGGVVDNDVADIRPPVLAAAAGGSPDCRLPSHSHRRIQRAASASASLPSGKQPGVARGLLMTPWFAAASGFVIAASLWIYSSHPQLTFPIATGSVPCTPDGCSPQNVDRDGAGSLAINSGQPMPQRHKPATSAKKVTRDQARTAASGLTFGYVEESVAPGKFALIITVAGKHAVKKWHLAFVLPGDHIQWVAGAHWHAAGDRVTTSPLTGDPSQHGGGPWDASGGDAYQGAGQASHSGSADGFGGPNPDGFSFTVIASGPRAVPTDCRYDGAACTFHRLPGHRLPAS